MSNYSYTPTQWVGNKTIATAEIMNNIENGIVGSFSFTNSVFNLVQSHINNHPGGGGGSDVESATEDDINSIFGSL